MKRARVKRLCFRLLLWICVGLAWIMDAVADPLPPPQRWNVLLIVSDDLNCDLGCYGNPVVQTPNIDRLAGRGMRFARAYCQYPLCNPSRASFLSGMRPDATQVFDNDEPPRAAVGKIPFLPEYFHKNGYFTARFGKIAHEKFEDAVAWDKIRNFIRPVDSLEDAILPLHVKPTEDADEDEPDGELARRAAGFLGKEHREPFFLAVGFRKPHVPLAAPRKYFALYPPQTISLPRKPDGELIPHPARTHRARHIEDAKAREMIEGYYACVSFMDAQVGVLLGALEQARLADHTIVVLMSDHGFLLGEHGLWEKQILFEECTRVPLIVVVPGMQRAGESCGRLVEYVDIYPTLNELCALPERDDLQGTSFVPLLADPNRPWKSAVFSQVKRQAGDSSAHARKWDRFWDHFFHGTRHDLMGRSVETEQYHYIEWGNESVAQLFDLRTDPHEYTNLVGRADCAGLRAQLHSTLLDGWREALPPK